MHSHYTTLAVPTQTHQMDRGLRHPRAQSGFLAGLEGILSGSTRHCGTPNHDGRVTPMCGPGNR